MTLISQANVRTGLVVLRRQFLQLRSKCSYIIKHEPDGPKKEALLNEVEKEIDDLTDCLNLLTSLKKD